MKNLPLISCLMVTAPGREKEFQWSYQCYQWQTYPHRELIIVTDGNREYYQFLQNITKNDQEVTVHFEEQKKTLGELRNISLELAKGDIIVQWDDDDFNHPARLFLQYGCLERNQAKVCFFGEQLQYFFHRRHLYWCNWYHLSNVLPYRIIPGSLMAYRQPLLYYPPWPRYEDMDLAYRLCDSQNIAILKNRAYLLIYSFHQKNTWSEEHHRGIATARAASAKKLWPHRKKIDQFVRQLGWKDVTVMSKEGPVWKIEENQYEVSN